MLTGSSFSMIITTAQKMKFFVENFFRKCDQILRKLVKKKKVRIYQMRL